MQPTGLQHVDEHPTAERIERGIHDQGSYDLERLAELTSADRRGIVGHGSLRYSGDWTRLGNEGLRPLNERGSFEAARRHARNQQAGGAGRQSIAWMPDPCERGDVIG